MRSTIWCLAALLAAALFLFCVTDGNLSIHGDDALIVGHASFYRPDASYLFNVAARVFLTGVYIRIYDFVGADPWRMHIVFLALHVVNMLLCFFVLRKILGIRPALLGALIYLFYSGSYETVTWLSAGGYLIVMTIFFVSIWIALSDWTSWAKGLTIALMTWAAMHLYEVLIVAAPLYPILTAAFWWHKQRRVPRDEFLPSLMPLVAMLLHWLFMFLGRLHYPGPSIWMRNPGQKTDPWSILKAFVHVGELGFSACCGTAHWDFLSVQHQGILAWHPFGPGYYALLAVSLVLLAWVWIRNRAVLEDRNARVLLVLLAAAYLIFLSPLVAVTIADTAFPSRLLVLCGAGLAFGSAALAARWPNVLVAGLLLCAGAAEGLGLQSVLVQEQTANAVDSKIRSQLLALRLNPQLGDRFFFSLPDFPERKNLWHAAFSQFESGGQSAFLVIDFGFMHNEKAPFDQRLPLLRRQVRDNGPQEFNVPVPAPGEARRLYPFFVQDNLQLMVVTPLEITAGDRILRRYDNPEFAALPIGKVSARAAAAWYNEGELHLNFYQPDLQLEIRGRVHGTHPGATLETRDSQRTVALWPLTANGDFVGRIPLASLQPNSVLTMHAAGDVAWEFQTTTFAPLQDSGSVRP